MAKSKAATNVKGEVAGGTREATLVGLLERVRGVWVGTSTESSEAILADINATIPPEAFDPSAELPSEDAPPASAPVPGVDETGE